MVSAFPNKERFCGSSVILSGLGHPVLRALQGSVRQTQSDELSPGLAVPSLLAHSKSHWKQKEKANWRHAESSACGHSMWGQMPGTLRQDWRRKYARSALGCSSLRMEDECTGSRWNLTLESSHREASCGCFPGLLALRGPWPL